ncbi:MAG: M28 family peptidase [Gemmatimonadetes bacterium]|nr:M28 family peptidase [Gemmatimonadota bacterium]
MLDLRTALLCCGVLAAGGCASLPPPPPPPLALEIQRDLAYLASPAREGRQIGSAGRDSAAAWIARRFDEAGARPVFAEPCMARHPCPPGRWGDAFQLPEWAVGGTGVNVAARVEGRDPALRRHVVVVGAHYDHIGRLSQYSRDPATPGLRPGADDNASGTAALLELARRVAARPAPMTVLFVAFDAEELGLFGSRHFLSDPPVPAERMAAMLNFDMVGRMRTGRLTVRNVGSATWWRDAVERANTDSLRIDLQRGGGSSDHVSFREARIPAIHFYTGTHADYHRRSDREEHINYLGILRVVDLAERVLRDMPPPGPSS